MNDRWSRRPAQGFGRNAFHRLMYSMAAGCLGLTLAVTATASDRLDDLSGEKVDWHVVAGGGTQGSSGGYLLGGTVGQTSVGPGASPSHRLYSGFWQSFAAACQGRCGNANGGADNKVNVADASYIINFVFVPGSPGPQPVYACGNANGGVDGKANVADATYIINFVFVPGSPGPSLCPFRPGDTAACCAF